MRSAGHICLVIFLAAAVVSVPTAAAQTIVDSQYNVLVSISAAWAATASGNRLSSWGDKGKPCTQWAGLTCSAAGFVTDLDLSGQGLQGNIPGSLLAQLLALKTLKLHNNELTGSFPIEVSSLTALSILSLGQNDLVDTLPTTLDRLSNLQYLMLSKNKLHGPLPSSIGTLPNLVALDLSMNGFYGTVPSSYTSFPSIVYFDLSDNQLTGAPPLSFTSGAISNRPLATYSIRSNYFIGPYLNSPILGNSQPACPPTMQGSYAFNNLAGYAPTIGGGSNARNCISSGPGDCKGEQQRGPQSCYAFCGLGTSSGVCGGHGTCYLDGESRVPNCICDAGYYTSTASVQSNGGKVTYPTCVASKPAPSPPPPSGSGDRNNRRGGFASNNQSLTEVNNNSHFNKYFRHASVGFNGTSDAPSWNYLTAVDWRDSGAVLTPSDQGSCKSCWALVATAAVESAYAIQYATSSPGLSAQQVINCQGTWACSGGLPSDALQYISAAASGIVSNNSLTYTGVAGTCTTGKESEKSSKVTSSASSSVASSSSSSPSTSSPSPRSSLRSFSRGRKAQMLAAMASAAATVSAAAFPGSPATARTARASNRIIGSGYAPSSGVPPPPLSSPEYLRGSRYYSPSSSSHLSAFPMPPSLSSAFSSSSSFSSSPHSSYATRRKLKFMDWLRGFRCKRRGGSFCAVPPTPPRKSPPPPPPSGSTLSGPFSIAMFEQVSISGWLGMVLALQKQPIIAYIEADADTFVNFTGGYVYDDSTCFSNGVVDHTVVVVGYNLLAAVPYFIIKNSWGTSWGDSGYMQLSITGGDGTCGINTTPALYPVVKGSSACGLINPCGDGTCTAKSNGLNTCSCPSGFIAVTNIDGSQSCSPIHVCKFSGHNLCNIGSCVDDLQGAYNCLCPNGYVTGASTDGTPACIPGTTGSSIKSFAGLTCDTIRYTYYISSATFTSLNPTLNCASLQANQTVNIGSPISCALTYTPTTSDNCSSIADAFSTTTTSLQSINPDLDCNDITKVPTICIQTGNSIAQICSSYYTVQSGDTCSDIVQQARTGITLSDLFSLNPGLTCDSGSSQLFAGEQVCTKGGGSITLVGASYCKTSKYYTVVRGDSCSTIISKKYSGSSASFISYNSGMVCTNAKLYVGLKLCIP